ncbi:hypothetical protein B5X24_HaOG213484 [Helicoverpa armigera]|uniref:Uncharacterized protein n=1 Tax=Helicoverpa armigera TaxID=29058 RepID=A0A2W1B9H1_HELAM|nr:hypothetical protein B5X24_HaOG213484 [Helicoverpa armigera]
MIQPVLLLPPQRRPKPRSDPTGAKRVRTSSFSARRRELEAKEELARRELQAAQTATKLARVRLELAHCETPTGGRPPSYKTAPCQRRSRRARSGQSSSSSKSQQEATSGSASIEVQALTAALRDAFGRSGAASAPKYLHELPTFDGCSSEWMAFRVVYEDTASLFSEAQNMARLRRALRGTAREAMKSLLYSEAAPADVMLALKRRFGRPEALVPAESK